MFKIINTEIKICGACKGKGYISEIYCSDYNKKEYDAKNYTCRKCFGSGRIKENTIIETEAYNPEWIDHTGK